jgi:hypothetical protein
MVLTKFRTLSSEELLAHPPSTELERELEQRVEGYLEMEQELEDLRYDVDALRRHLSWALDHVVKPEAMSTEEWEELMQDAELHI